jgi:hypothetical protein
MKSGGDSIRVIGQNLMAFVAIRVIRVCFSPQYGDGAVTILLTQLPGTTERVSRDCRRFAAGN